MFSLTKSDDVIILKDNKHNKTYPISIEDIDYIVGDDNKLRNESIIERFIELRENKDKPISMITKTADLKKEYEESNKTLFKNVGNLIDLFINKYNLSNNDIKILSEIPDDVGIRKLKKNDATTRNMMYDLRELKKNIKNEDQTISDTFNYLKSYLKSYTKTIEAPKDLLDYIRDPNNYEGVWKENCKRFNNFKDVVDSGCPRMGTIKLNIIRRHKEFFTNVIGIIKENETKLYGEKYRKETVFEDNQFNNQMVFGTEKIDYNKLEINKKNKNKNKNTNYLYFGVSIRSNYITQFIKTFIDRYKYSFILRVLAFYGGWNTDSDVFNFYNTYENIIKLSEILNEINQDSIESLWSGRGLITNSDNLTPKNTYINRTLLQNESYFIDNICDKLDQKEEDIYRNQYIGAVYIFNLAKRFKNLGGKNYELSGGWTDKTLTRIDNINETLREYSTGRLYFGHGKCGGWTDKTLTRIDNINETLRQYI